MALGARRTFRFALVVALALALAYALAMPLPFFAPLFAVLLLSKPGPPVALKALIALILLVLVTTGIGLFLIPFLRDDALPTLLVIASGLFLSTMVTVGRGQALAGALLGVGFALIPAAGLLDYALAAQVADSLMGGIAISVVCSWIVYPLFPEDPGGQAEAPPPPATLADARWIATRATLIVMPPLLVTFSNPGLYIPTIMKTLLLAQQGSVVTAREAGHELLGSTLIAGCFAIVVWFALKLWPGLWMFFLWMLLFGLYLAGKMYGVITTRRAPSYWMNVAVTMLILLGPAVQDGMVGNDVYKGFAVRFSLFVAVTLYAWGAIVALEWLRARGHAGKGWPARPTPE